MIEWLAGASGLPRPRDLRDRSATTPGRLRLLSALIATGATLLGLAEYRI